MLTVDDQNDLAVRRVIGTQNNSVPYEVKLWLVAKYGLGTLLFLALGAKVIALIQGTPILEKLEPVTGWPIQTVFIGSTIIDLFILWALFKPVYTTGKHLIVQLFCSASLFYHGLLLFAEHPNCPCFGNFLSSFPALAIAVQVLVFLWMLLTLALSCRPRVTSALFD